MKNAGHIQKMGLFIVDGIGGEDPGKANMGKTWMAFLFGQFP